MQFCQRTDASTIHPEIFDPQGHNSTFSRSNRTIIDDLLDHLCDTPEKKKKNKERCQKYDPMGLKSNMI